MRAVILGFATSCSINLELVVGLGIGGEQKQVKQSYVPKHHTFHHLLGVGYHSAYYYAEPAPTPALDLMKRLASTVIPHTHHPALAEIVKVAQELVDSHDESLADATIETFHQSLIKLADVAKEDPPTTGPIADMRADVCGSKKDLHQKECLAFMKLYCAANTGKDSCAAFFGEEKKEKEKKGGEGEGKDGGNPGNSNGGQKKNSGSPPVPAPSQGFEGQSVAHADGESMTSDWGREFGPGQAATYESVCAKHPNNQWCNANGYAPFWHSGAASQFISTSLVSMILLSSIMWF